MGKPPIRSSNTASLKPEMIAKTNNLRNQKMSYVIRREINPNHAAIVFEFDQQSEAELLRDFPWLGQIGVFAFGSRLRADTVLEAECVPRTRRSRRQRSS